jgi:hypothetical protein
VRPSIAQHLFVHITRQYSARTDENEIAFVCFWPKKKRCAFVDLCGGQCGLHKFSHIVFCEQEFGEKMKKKRNEDLVE